MKPRAEQNLDLAALTAELDRLHRNLQAGVDVEATKRRIVALHNVLIRMGRSSAGED